MDFSTRGFQRNNDARPVAPSTTGAPTSGGFGEDQKQPTFPKQATASIKRSKPLFVLSILLFVSLLVLTVATIVILANRSSERSYLEDKKYQAVFLDGGQVYFGKISELNSRFMSLNNIFYLNVTNSSVQPDTAAGQNITLIKLGCELHGPNDTMIINRDKVQFWENLKADGQVAEGIAKWKKENPKGQVCPKPAESTNTDSTTNTTDTTDTNADTTDDTQDTNP
jgi:hypothetical protein